jgi:hypothetical protein
MDTGVYLPSKILPAFVVVFTIAPPGNKDRKENNFNTTDLSGIYKLTSLMYKANINSKVQDNFLSVEQLGNNQVVVLHVNKNEDKDLLHATPDPALPGIRGSIISNEGVMDGVIQQFDQHAFVFYRSDFYMPGDKLIFTLKKNQG